MFSYVNPKAPKNIFTKKQPKYASKPMEMKPPRPLPKGINAEALIEFPLPESFDPDYKGFDVVLAAFTTREWGMSPPERQTK